MCCSAGHAHQNASARLAAPRHCSTTRSKHLQSGRQHSTQARRLPNSLIDGSRFCSELAGYTNATVIAATDTQFYTMAPAPGVLSRLFGIGPQDEIDFGEWEGKVMRFSPDGSKDTYK